MKDLKFRTPVICQNGHKALWYWHIVQEKDGVVDLRNIGVSEGQNCKCPKCSFGEGWRRVGEDEQCVRQKDKNGIDIYENDIVKYKDIDNDAFIMSANPIIGIVRWNENRSAFRPQEIKENHKGGHYFSNWDSIQEIEVIANAYMYPEYLVQSLADLEVNICHVTCPDCKNEVRLGEYCPMCNPELRKP